MAKTALKRKQKKKLAARPKTPFEKVWAKVEKKQKRNQEHAAIINKWFESFEKKVLPAEKVYLSANERLFKHLIVFFKRKSLSHHQRSNLFEWIEEVLNVFETNPFYDQNKLSNLHEQLNDAIDVVHANEREKEENKEHVIGQSEETFQDKIDSARETIDEMFGGEKEYTDEQLADFVRNPSSFEEELHRIFEQMTDSDDDEVDDEQEYFNPFDEQSPEQSARRQRLKSLFDNAQLSKIYKLLANKLHPDKETDPQLKTYKSEQMGLLSKAKKAKDAFTLIQMFQTHLPEKAKEFDPNLSESLCELLNEKLIELDREYEDISDRMGVAGIVWDRFGAKTNKQIESNFQEHIQNLNEGREDCDETIQSVTNLKTLKQLLRDRESMSRHDHLLDVLLNEMEDGLFTEHDFYPFGHKGI